MAFLNLDGAETPHGRNSVKTNKKQIMAYIPKLACTYTGTIIKMSRNSKLQHTEPGRAKLLTAESVCVGKKK
jgi:hypothetical protein